MWHMTGAVGLPGRTCLGYGNPPTLPPHCTELQAVTQCLLAPHSLPLPHTNILSHFRPPSQHDACYVSCDGGRVCRPLIICDAGVPRVTQDHITKLKRGARGCDLQQCLGQLRVLLWGM